MEENEFEQWLCRRGQNTTGLVADLREQIKRLKKQSRGSHKELAQPCGSLNLVQQVVGAFYFSLRFLMQQKMNPGDSHEAKCLARLLLTKYDKWDVHMRGEKGTPTWITKYNFVCLLKLPRVMRKLGPLINLGEGGFGGEGMIQYVKCESWMGMRMNSEISTAETLKRRSL